MSKKINVQNATEEIRSNRNLKRRRYDIVDDDEGSDEEEIESDEASVYDKDNVCSFCFKIYRLLYLLCSYSAK